MWFFLLNFLFLHADASQLTLGSDPEPSWEIDRAVAEPSFEPERLRTRLKEMKRDRNFPILKVPSTHKHYSDLVFVREHFSKLPAATGLIPERLLEGVRRINLQIFGDETFYGIKACTTDAECLAGPAASLVTDRVFYLSSEFVEALQSDLGHSGAWEDAANFVIAHEIAHFALEAMILSSSDGRSPHGFKSMLFDAEHPADNSTPDELLAYIKRMSQLHAEVDILAIVMLEESGLSSDGAEIAFDFLKRSTLAQLPVDSPERQQMTQQLEAELDTRLALIRRIRLAQ